MPAGLGGRLITDYYHKCFMTDGAGDIMPLIAPPSPVEDDFYVDDCLALQYESSLMTESQLPNFSPGRDKLMYTGLLVMPTPATASATTTLISPKQTQVPRERSLGHPAVKKRKLNSSTLASAGSNLVRQSSCPSTSVILSSGSVRPPITSTSTASASLVAARHYRSSVTPVAGSGVKAAVTCTSQMLDRERPIAVNAGSGSAVTSSTPGVPAVSSGACSTPQTGERLSSTAQAAQLRSMLPRAVFQRDSTGAHKMRGRNLPPYPARHRTGLPTVRGHSLGPLVHSKLPQEWTAHEESALFTSLTQLQDIHFNSAMAERYPCWQVHSPNFLLSEFFINTYSRPRCFRSHRQIMSHYESLQTSLSSGQHSGPTSASALLASGSSVASGSNPGTPGVGTQGSQSLHSDTKQSHPGVKMKRKSSVAASAQHRFRALTTPSGADNPAAAAAMANSAEGKYSSWLGVAKTVGKRKRPPGQGPPGAGNSATQGMIQRNSLHVAALQESHINPDLLLGPMQIIKAKEEREQRLKDQPGEHAGVSGTASGAASSASSFAHPATASVATAHKLQVTTGLGAQGSAAQSSQQQRILVAGPGATSGTAVSAAALQRRGGVIAQGTTLSAAAHIRRQANASSVGSAQNSPRILQRPQAGNTVQMASLIRQQQISGMTQVAKRGGGGGAGVSASGQPTASARIQALGGAGAATSVAMVSQATGSQQQFRAAGISVNTGAGQARLVTTTGGTGMVGHAGGTSSVVNTAQVAAIIRAKQAQVAAGGTPTLVKSLSCGQRLQATGQVSGQAAGATAGMGTPVQIIQPAGQRGVQTTVTVQQIQQLIRPQAPNVPHIISGAQAMSASSSLRRATTSGGGEPIVISRYPATSVSSASSVLGTEHATTGGGTTDANSGLKDSSKKE